jgi:SAM-dependent methyltransferase
MSAAGRGVPASEGSPAVHWTEAYYGDLYLDSVEDLLTPSLSALEASAIALLLGLRPDDRVLDAGSGHGRHLRALGGRGLRTTGLDRSGPYLRRARELGLPAGASLVRADVRALPFREGAFAAAFSWYASLFVFDEGQNASALAGLARAVRRSGRVLVQHGNPLRLAARPREEVARTLADGTRVEEESVFDPVRGVDRCLRRLVRPDGSRLEAAAELRYYSAVEWGPLAARAGLRLLEITDTAGAARTPRRPPGPEAPDLVAVLEKPA